jgi:hypothetical protein
MRPLRTMTSEHATQSVARAQRCRIGAASSADLVTTFFHQDVRAVPSAQARCRELNGAGARAMNVLDIARGGTDRTDP